MNDNFLNKMLLITAIAFIVVLVYTEFVIIDFTFLSFIGITIVTLLPCVAGLIIGTEIEKNKKSNSL